jgi:hypothetical protein
MEMQHQEVLKTLKAGELSEDAAKTIESVAAEVASKYINSK